MASDLVNLTEKAAKLSIEPLFDSNWCDMSDDIKLKCIGKMELKERLSLRSTAKAEKSLVDSQKIKFTRGVFFGYTFFSFVFFPDNKYNFSMRPQFMSENLKLINYVKKIGVFENLTFSLGHPLRSEEKFSADDELFTAKNIEFNTCSCVQVIPVLRKMKNGVESIEFNGVLSDELGQILEIPIVQNVPYWYIQNYDQANSLHMVAQMWIDNDSKIGFTFQVSVREVDGSFEEFLENFDDRILSENYKRARIRTNNPDRHILLERGLDDFVKIDWDRQFFRLMMISAEMEESEYDDNCEEWICKMDPVMPGMYAFHYKYGRI